MRPAHHRTPPRHTPPRRTRPRWALLVVVAALVVTGCSSDDESPATTTGPSALERLRARNLAYLEETGWEPEQARCVSRRVQVDLEALLSGDDGDPTANPDFEEFAAAVRVCISADEGLTTTTTGGG